MNWWIDSNHKSECTTVCPHHTHCSHLLAVYSNSTVLTSLCGTSPAAWRIADIILTGDMHMITSSSGSEANREMADDVRRTIAYIQVSGWWVLVCWWGHFDWSFAHFIPPFITTTSITLSSIKNQNGDILVPANPGPPWKWPLKWREKRLWLRCYLTFYSGVANSWQCWHALTQKLN